MHCRNALILSNFHDIVAYMQEEQLSKYNIYLTEHEARTVIRLLEIMMRQRGITKSEVDTMVRILNKIEEQSDWNSFQ